MRYKVGEKVIYPGRGICEVKGISTQEFDGTGVDFYRLGFLRDDATVMVPVGKARSIGIRRLLNKSEVPRVWAALKQPIKAPSRDYKVRYQRNVDRLASGTIFEIADVVKSLTILSTTKKLTDRENEMLERARTLLVNEITQVTDGVRTEVEAKVDDILARCVPLNDPSEPQT